MAIRDGSRIRSLMDGDNGTLGTNSTPNGDSGIPGGTAIPYGSNSPTNTGFNGGNAQSASPSAGPVPGFGDNITAQSIYDTSGMTDAQRSQMASDTAARRARDQAGAQKDADYMTSRNGQASEAGYQFYKPEGADPSAGDYGGKLVGGTEFKPDNMPNATDDTGGTGGSSGGSKPWDNVKGFLMGFDPDKLNSPDSGKDAGSKYTPAAKLYSKIVVAVPGGRGNLQARVDALKQSGFPNAKTVGDDKIDFGDGNGPIDVVTSDGKDWMENTTGNQAWEQKYAGGAGTTASGAASGGGSAVGGSGMPVPTGGITTPTDNDQLKSILQKYYGGAGGGLNLGMHIGSGTSVH